MKPMPEAEIYDLGLLYWPYRTTLEMVQLHAVWKAPQGGRLLDMMCGTGYLLGRIQERRPDLKLYGVDIDERYVSHARAAYPEVTFDIGDVLEWKAALPYDMVVCAGSLHHVPYKQQEPAIARIAEMVKRDGVAIISDCYVDDYSDEVARKLAAARLGYKYLRHTIAAGAPESVISWTIDILSNDVLMHEYKPSLRQRLPLIRKHFARVSTTKTWPSVNDGYGEYVHICTFP